jgi:hypothetical protein
MCVFALFVKQTEPYSRTDPMSLLYSSIKQNGCAPQETHATDFNKFTLSKHLCCTYFACQLHHNQTTKNIPKYLEHVVWGSTYDPILTSIGGRSCFLVKRITSEFEEKKTFNDVQAVWTTLWASLNSLCAIYTTKSSAYWRNPRPNDIV